MATPVFQTVSLPYYNYVYRSRLPQHLGDVRMPVLMKPAQPVRPVVFAQTATSSVVEEKSGTEEEQEEACVAAMCANLEAAKDQVALVAKPKEVPANGALTKEAPAKTPVVPTTLKIDSALTPNVQIAETQIAETQIFEAWKSVPSVSPIEKPAALVAAADPDIEIDEAQSSPPSNTPPIGSLLTVASVVGSTPGVSPMPPTPSPFTPAVAPAGPNARSGQIVLEEQPSPPAQPMEEEEEKEGEEAQIEGLDSEDDSEDDGEDDSEDDSDIDMEDTVVLDTPASPVTIAEILQGAPIVVPSTPPHSVSQPSSNAIMVSPPQVAAQPTTPPSSPHSLRSAVEPQVDARVEFRPAGKHLPLLESRPAGKHPAKHPYPEKRPAKRPHQEQRHRGEEESEQASVEKNDEETEEKNDEENHHLHHHGHHHGHHSSSPSPKKPHVHPKSHPSHHAGATTSVHRHDDKVVHHHHHHRKAPGAALVSFSNFFLQLTLIFRSQGSSRDQAPSRDSRLLHSQVVFQAGGREVLQKARLYGHQVPIRRHPGPAGSGRGFLGGPLRDWQSRNLSREARYPHGQGFETRRHADAQVGDQHGLYPLWRLQQPQGLERL